MIAAVIRCAVVFAVAMAPALTGAIDVSPLLAVATAAATLSLAGARQPALRRAGLVLGASALAVALVDLAVRPFTYWIFDARPPERFTIQRPLYPDLRQYRPNVTYDGETFGDLGASHRTWREPRQVRYLTDAFGFRNRPDGPWRDGPLDVILLGDSFGVASTTTQDDRLADRLARDHRLRTYDLSVSGTNPRQQYATLVLEAPRLQTRAGTTVLWLLFPTNDLDEPYSPALENPQPQVLSLPVHLSQTIVGFRTRSPVRRVLASGAADDVEMRPLPNGQPMLFLRPYADRRGRAAADVRAHRNFTALRSTLDAMRDLTRRHDWRVMMAVVPSKEEVYGWVLDGGPPWSSGDAASGFVEAIRPIATELGFDFVDLKPAFVAASRRLYERDQSLLWWRDDTHWNASGQREAADLLYARLAGSAPSR